MKTIALAACLMALGCAGRQVIEKEDTAPGQKTLTLRGRENGVLRCSRGMEPNFRLNPDGDEGVICDGNLNGHPAHCFSNDRTGESTCLSLQQSDHGSDSVSEHALNPTTDVGFDTRAYSTPWVDALRIALVRMIHGTG
jgi:hypothetical protein